MGKRKGFVDLGAERLVIGAEKGNEKIAVEIKSFLGVSEVDQFEDAMGQFLVYRPAILKIDPERILWLALPFDFYSNLFEDSYFQEIAILYDVKMIVYDELNLKIISWKK